MTRGWKETTLGEICDRGQARIQTGPFGSQLHSHDYQPVGIPVVPTEGIGRRRLRNDEIPRVSEAVADRLSRHKLKTGDILFARRGAQATGLSALSREQVDTLAAASSLPSHIKTFVEGFEGKLSEEEFNSPKFAYRVLFVAKTANRKGQADQVVEFVKSDSELAKQVNATYVITKETERQKYRPGKIVAMMQKEGFKRFNMHEHTEFWKAEDAKMDGKGFGVLVEDCWYWYEPWLDKVRTHCKSNEARYKQ